MDIENKFPKDFVVRINFVCCTCDHSFRISVEEVISHGAPFCAACQTGKRGNRRMDYDKTIVAAPKSVHENFPDFLEKLPESMTFRLF